MQVPLNACPRDNCSKLVAIAKAQMVHSRSVFKKFKRIAKYQEEMERGYEWMMFATKNVFIPKNVLNKINVNLEKSDAV